MRYGSICSGIEAASVAWHGLGWRPVFFSEIEPFPSAVLSRRWPGVANLGDFTRIGPDAGPVDLLVGGTPCQSFSVAGNRDGMGDARGALALEHVALAARLGARWLVWENVPGALSSNGGRDFGRFLGALEDCGYGYAWRVLDAQHFGLAQRRKRVFLVGHSGDWRPPAAVLFEPESLRGDPAPRREARKEVARCLTRGASQRYDAETETLIAFDPTQITSVTNRSRPEVGDPCHTLGALARAPHIAHAFDARQSDVVQYGYRSGALDTDGHSIAVLERSTVRRLTPRECERLQGFPDDYTAIPWRGRPASECPDGPRYRAIGNSMAVPVMRWIGERIDLVDRVVAQRSVGTFGGTASVA